MLQDYIFTFGSLTFIIALIPSVISNNKPAITTSLLSGSVLVVFAVTYLTLQLFFTAGLTLVIALTWLFLAWQKYSQDTKEYKKVTPL